MRLAVVIASGLLLIALTVTGTLVTWLAYAPENVRPSTMPVILTISLGVAILTVLLRRVTRDPALSGRGVGEGWANCPCGGCVPGGVIATALLFCAMPLLATVKYGYLPGFWLDSLVFAFAVLFAVAWWFDRVDCRRAGWPTSI